MLVILAYTFPKLSQFTVVPQSRPAAFSEIDVVRRDEIQQTTSSVR